ncbi:unnamed protein product [Gadus morhua 'NCC']
MDGLMGVLPWISRSSKGEPEGALGAAEMALSCPVPSGGPVNIEPRHYGTSPRLVTASRHRVSSPRLVTASRHRVSSPHVAGSDGTQLNITWLTGQSISPTVESASLVSLESLEPPGQLTLWLLEVEEPVQVEHGRS